MIAPGLKKKCTMSIEKLPAALDVVDEVKTTRIIYSHRRKVVPSNYTKALKIINIINFSQKQ